MALIEYRCNKCNKTFELLTQEEQVCPHCKNKEIERLYSFNGLFKFRGAGFYANEKIKPYPRKTKI